MRRLILLLLLGSSLPLVADALETFEENNLLASLEKYERETTDSRIWQLPSEFEASGIGDCEDFSIRFLWDAFWLYNEEGSLIIAEKDGYLHCFASLDRIVYDPYMGVRIGYWGDFFQTGWVIKECYPLGVVLQLLTDGSWYSVR